MALGEVDGDETRNTVVLPVRRWVLFIPYEAFLFSAETIINQVMWMWRGPPTGSAHRLRQYAIWTPEARIMGRSAEHHSPLISRDYSAKYALGRGTSSHTNSFCTICRRI